MIEGGEDGSKILASKYISTMYLGPNKMCKQCTFIYKQKKINKRDIVEHQYRKHKDDFVDFITRTDNERLFKV